MDEPRAPEIRRVRALVELGRLDRALADLRALLASDPEDAEALELLGLCHVRRGEAEPAAAALASAIHVDPGRAHLHYLLGHTFTLRKDPGRAERAFREALRIAPDEPVYLRAAAEHLAQRGQHEEALALARHAVAVAADGSANHRTLGYVSSSAGQLEQAFGAYRKALELDPEDGEAWNNLGCVAFARGEPLLAREHFREALRLDPRGERSRHNLGLVSPRSRPRAIFSDWEAFLAEVLRDLVDGSGLGGPVRALALVQALGQPVVARAMTVRMEEKGVLGRLGAAVGPAALKTAVGRLGPSSVRAWAAAGAAMGVGWLVTARSVTPLRRRFVEQIAAAKKAWEDQRKAWVDGQLAREAREAQVVRLVERLAAMLADKVPGVPSEGLAAAAAPTVEPASATSASDGQPATSGPDGKPDPA